MTTPPRAARSFAVRLGHAAPPNSPAARPDPFRPRRGRDRTGHRAWVAGRYVVPAGWRRRSRWQRCWPWPRSTTGSHRSAGGDQLGVALSDPRVRDGWSDSQVELLGGCLVRLAEGGVLGDAVAQRVDGDAGADGERTPDLPHSTGLVYGLTRATAQPSTMARAAVEGMLCGLADAVDALRAQGLPVERVLLLGGAARSRAVQALAPALLGAPVVLPEPGEYVALGAARQAAWAVSGAETPPSWETAVSKPESSVMSDSEATRVRELYASVLAGTRPLLAASKDWPAKR